jgi:hypothetical protein
MTLNVKNFVGDLEVIHNGTIHVTKDKPLVLQIDDLKMKFNFLIDNKEKSFHTNYFVKDDTLHWELTNYTNSLGTGIIEPVIIGTLKRRKLYASFFVWTPNANEERRIINFVLYLGEEVKNDV